VIAVRLRGSFEFLSQDAVADLNPRQQAEYAHHRKPFIEWMRTCGKDPDRGVPLSASCVHNYARRLHQLHQWLWEQSDRRPLSIGSTQADRLIAALENDEFQQRDGSPYSASSKRKFMDVLQKWFAYRHHEYGDDPWEPPIRFTDNTPELQADPFTKDERSRLYEAALTYKTPPAYDNLTPEERDRWKAYLAQRLGKSKDEVEPADFAERRHSWKIPSLIGAALDAGLRPVEVHRLQVDWLRLDKGTIHIPKESAAKNDEHWEVTLRERTVRALDRWLSQRATKTKYDDSDAVWLNQNGNRYDSKSLNYLLDNLLEAANISQDNRRLVWYSIRKSTGQYVYNNSDDLMTANVLRCTQENVQHYAEPPHEEKRSVLDQIDG
jgi:site-specific recombinase XerD